MWRSTTFLEIQNRILDQMPKIQSIDLFNNQIDDYTGDTNNSALLNMPLVLIEFVGGDWEKESNYRIAKQYFFRLHLVIENYQRTHSGADQQNDALSMLDDISTLANVLDKQSLTFAHNFEFDREEIDTSRTSIIHHILDFEARAVDCSLDEALTLQKIVITQQEIITNHQSSINAFVDNNTTSNNTGGFKIS